MQDEHSIEDMLDQTEVVYGDTAILKHPSQQALKVPTRRPSCVRLILADDTKLDAPARPFITIGRRDKRKDESVDIDFAHLGGRDKGVSRRHAVLSVGTSSVFIKDMNSSNGTILNGETLSPMREYALKDGDEIMLGKVQVTVKFIY